MTTTPQNLHVPPPDYAWPAEQQPPVAKKRHAFRWVFLAVQAMFLISVISGLTSTAPACAPSLSPAACQAAQGIGTGIGVALIVGLWLAVDVILGISYLIFRKR